MEKDRPLLVFHSRTGYTRRIATEISAALDCDVEELRDRVARGGPFGYALSMLEAASRFDTLMQPSRNAPAGRPLVIVGTPIWVWSLSSPVRTWARAHRGALPPFAFFCTCGSSGGPRALAELESLCGANAVASLMLTDGEIDRGSHAAKLGAFVDALAAATCSAGTARRPRTARS